MYRTANMKKYLYIVVISFCFLVEACSSKTGGLDPEENVNFTLSGITPLAAVAGAEVTITGNGFSTTPSDNQIVLGGRLITPSRVTSTTLVFNVPSDMADGAYYVSVKESGKTVSLSQKFNVYTNVGNKVFTVPVAAKDINSLFFSKGKLNVHPRFILEKSDIDKLKQIISKDANEQAMYNDIITRANNILNTSILTYGLDAANLRISNIHTISNDQVPYLVLAYLFTKDARYAERCWKQFDAMCSWPDWGAGRHFLDTGIVSKACAMVYDGLYDYLTAAQRSKLYAATKKFALQPGLDIMKGGSTPFRWYLSNDNWNGICHGGLIDAALSMYEEDPAFHSEIISLASAGMMKYMDSLLPDGASEEGMSYWSYGLTNTIMSFEAMKRSLGSSLGLSEMQGFEKTGWFPYLISGPVGTPSFGDDYIYNGVNYKFLSQFWYARENNDADLAKTHYNACLQRNAASTAKLNGWLDFLYYDPDLVAKGNEANIALKGYMRGIDYVYLKENNTLQSYYIGMHIGDNNASHGHLDAGSIYIQANEGIFGMGNLGTPGSYPANYFSDSAPTYSSAPTQTVTQTGRFSYYRVRTEGKSALVINPDARPEQDPKGVGALYKSGDDYYIADLTSCYNRDVTNYKRGIRLDKTAHKMIIQDEFTLKSSSLVYWLLHTPALDSPELSLDKKSVVLNTNGHKLILRILSPQSATFDIVGKNTTGINYLSETAPIFSNLADITNPINKYSGKVQIRLNGISGEQRIVVECGEVGMSVGQVISLNDW
jgi:hypothetical protein